MLAAYKSKGGRPRFHEDSKTTVGDHPSFSEPPRSLREAAESAGISPHQARQAINVSRIDRRQFEGVLEGDPTPNVVDLAKIGARQSAGEDAEDRSPKAKKRYAPPPYVEELRELRGALKTIAFAAQFRGADVLIASIGSPNVETWRQDIEDAGKGLLLMQRQLLARIEEDRPNHAPAYKRSAAV